MIMPNLKLNNEFWCHSHTPEYGFWGELRQMVRDDMTLGQAVDFLNHNWGFKGSAGAFEHEVSHQLFAILCIYEKNLRRFLPEIDNKTGFLKARGYNGFMNGELIVLGIQSFLSYHCKSLAPIKRKVNNVRHLDVNQYTVPFLYLRYGTEEGSFISWKATDKSEKPISIFEFRKNRGFNLASIELPNYSDLEEMLLSTYNYVVQPKNSHREKLLRKSKPSIFLMRKILAKLHDSFLHFQTKYSDEITNKDFTGFDKLWSDVKIRDLHVLIGGKEAAHEYFRKCGVPEYTQQKTAPKLEAAL